MDAWSLLLIPVVGGSIYSLLSVAATAIFMRREIPVASELAAVWPAVSVLKPVHGLEKDLEKNLRSACTLDSERIAVEPVAQTELFRQPCKPASELLTGHPLHALRLLAGGAPEILDLREPPRDRLEVGIHHVLEHAHTSALGRRRRQKCWLRPAIFDVFEDHCRVEDASSVLVDQSRHLATRAGAGEVARRDTASDGLGQRHPELDALFRQGDLHLLAVG